MCSGWIAFFVLLGLNICLGSMIFLVIRRNKKDMANFGTAFCQMAATQAGSTKKED
jgi:hypothetical protein